MLSPDAATIQALRSDVALQIARRARQLGGSQVAAAKHLGIAQPTLSKIMNGRVSDLSLELLIRIATRGGLCMALQTGQVPEESGAFVAGTSPLESRAQASPLADEARNAVSRFERGLTPAERLEAFVEHNQLVGALHAAGRNAEAKRARQTQQR
jgi:predicted XRE-type DNA-binding protein